MNVGNIINKLRSRANISQEQLAALLGVSRQAVQKWESGASVPELDKLVRMAKYFDISLDALVLDSDTRITEELTTTRELKPKYANIHDWESFSSGLRIEFKQATDEGLDLALYEEVFTAVSRLPKDEIKKRLGDVLFDVVRSAKTVPGYQYTEPSEIEEIRRLRKPYPAPTQVPDRQVLANKIHGAWLGRTCGCMLGKSIEGIRTNELIPFLQETGNYPLHRYIFHSDLNDDIINKYKFRFNSRAYADTIENMPSDDDMNYTVLAQCVIDKYGRDFTPYNISQAWLTFQNKFTYCSAERVAYCNFIKGYEPPESAVYKNPYREWIGAQIRGDYFGYINPGDPQTAADMAFRDASISHIKNGIYGEMFVAAMLATAACTDNLKDIILSGLAQIPYTSRLYKAITQLVNDWEEGTSQEQCFEKIHARFDEYTGHGWCHTISNAMIVAASLLYGEGDYSRSICMAVETGFDTDCNGATVGSIVGMVKGLGCIESQWREPIHDKLNTAIMHMGTVSISELAKHTLDHLPE